ncbi:MAG: alanine--tRNA ligase, partial [Odoribacter sp.]
EKNLKSNKNLMECVKTVLEENEGLKKETEKFARESLRLLKERLKNEKKVYKDINIITAQLFIPAAQVKCFPIKRGIWFKVIFVAGGVADGKPHLTIMIGHSLVRSWVECRAAGEAARKLKAGEVVSHFLLQAGGADPDGIESALEKAGKLIMHKIQVH